MERAFKIGKWYAAGLISVLSTALVSSSQAALIAQYDANAAGLAPDPTSTAGGTWTAIGASNANTPRAGGSELGTNFWGIQDSNPQGNSSLLYSKTLSSTEFGDPNGWWARARLRVISGSATVSGVLLELRDGANYFNVSFVNAGTDEYIGYTGTAGLVKVADAELSDAYVTVDAAYSPSSNDLAFYLNGSPIGTAPRSAFSSTGIFRIGFGTNTSSATGEHNWASVQFNTGAYVVPDPAAIGLIGLSILGFRRRRGQSA